jgi:hypothetical protein
VEELKQIIADIKREYWENSIPINRSKSIHWIEACNLRDRDWHNITYLVSEFTINHQDDGHSTIDITLNNRHFELTGRGILTENFGVRIWIGYMETGLIFQKEFVIDAPEPNFPESDFPTITLSGKDMMVQASDNEGIQVYSPGDNESTIRKIAQDHGWEYEDDDGFYDKKGTYFKHRSSGFYSDEEWEAFTSGKSPKHGRRVRSSISEYEFMKEMALESGNVLYLSNNYNHKTGESVQRLHFHKPKPKKEIIELWYRCPFNPMLNNVLSISIGEFTYKRGQTVSTGVTNIRSGKEIFSTSSGRRTPLDKMMIKDDTGTGKPSYEYRFSDHQFDKYTGSDGKSGNQKGSHQTPRRQRRAIYETLSTIIRGQVPDSPIRKYRHIPHLLKESSIRNSERVLENIDDSSHFLLELDVEVQYGLPHIFQGDIIRLLGAYFYDGLYYVKSVSHRKGSTQDLSTTLSLRGNSTFGTVNSSDGCGKRDDGDMDEEDEFDSGGKFDEKESYFYDEERGWRYGEDYR